MKRNVFLGTLFSAALAVTVAAQTTGSGTSSQPGQQSSKNQQQVTVTGCLSNADMAKDAAGTAGTAGTGQATGASRGEAQFMLNNARITERGAAGTSGTAGATTPSATGTAANNKFLLIGGNQTELKKYLNSEVEIRGTLQPRTDADRTGAGAAAGTGSGSASGQKSGSQSEMANVQRLRVTSVKQTSPTCAGG